MSKSIRIVRKLPISESLKLSWQRYLIDKRYEKDILTANNTKDKDQVRALQSEHRFEVDMLNEEEEVYFTQTKLRRARKLRVPIPHMYKENQINSDFWCEGRYTGGWYLTTKGIASLREEIRNELNARHETRTHWVVWLSALTGLIGAFTGLVALLSQL